MSGPEIQVNHQELEAKANSVVSRLKEVAANHERAYPRFIDAVLVFSGPGTYYDRLKPDQEEWMRWMDRDRIRAGVAVVREVTASALSNGRYMKRVRANQVTKQDIRDFGPLFVYNGTPLENEIFRRAAGSEFCKLPKENVVLIDEVREEDGTIHPMRHTADQVKSFYQQLANPESMLHGTINVAIVAHVPDFIRNVFYTKKYNDEFIAQGHQGLNFWVYGLRSRSGTEDEHIEADLSRLITYAEKGHLATEPSPFST